MKRAAATGQKRSRVSADVPAPTTTSLGGSKPPIKSTSTATAARPKKASASTTIQSKPSVPLATTKGPRSKTQGKKDDDEDEENEEDEEDDDDNDGEEDTEIVADSDSEDDNDETSGAGDFHDDLDAGESSDEDTGIEEAIEDASDEGEVEVEAFSEDDDDDSSETQDFDEASDKNTGQRVGQRLAASMHPRGNTSTKIDKRRKGIVREEMEDLAENSDSEDEAMKNRIGNVPLEWYKDEEHIGYDVYGKPIIRKHRGDEVDKFLERMDDPNAKRTIYDALNDEKIVMSNEEMNIINRIRKGQFPHASFNPDEDYTAPLVVRQEALGQVFEPKRRFIRSKWEAKKIVRLVHAIRNGWIKDPNVKEEKKGEENFDLWSEDSAETRNRDNIAAPKPLPPGHAESYNPPVEYLPSKEEIAIWEAMDPEERPQNFLPQKFEAMRNVPGYRNFITERFERCLDLYLCARVQKKRLNIDPESLIPKLPKPKDLRPFPTALAVEYRGHRGRVRCISVNPSGQWLASGSEDGTVRVWEVDSGRCFRIFRLNDKVTSLAWNPQPGLPLLAAVCPDAVVLLDAGTGTVTQHEQVTSLMKQAQSEAMDQKNNAAADVAQKKINKLCTWAFTAQTAEQGHGLPGADATVADSDCGAARLKLAITNGVSYVTWHAKGDYFSTISPKAVNTAVLIHRLSKATSTTPFTKSKGLIQSVLFHPSKPVFIVASERHVRIYNLVEQKLIKKMLSSARLISSMALHPSGDHLIVGSYDRRLSWYDFDLGDKPYKTLKYHKRAIRQVAFHPHYPLFATSSDDGHVHVLHSTVYDDLMTNPLIVPVKILKAHEPVDDVGVMDTCFHPAQPWVFSSGADQVIRLFT